MKFAVIAIMLGSAVFAADAKKTTATPKRPAAMKKVAPVTIPADAVKVNENTYRFTDTAGKTWLYQKTPFGISKVEEGANLAQAAPVVEKPADSTPFGKLTTSTQGATTKVTDAGESLTFERPTPFGVQKWTRKKSELNDDERAVWERQKSK